MKNKDMNIATANIHWREILINKKYLNINNKYYYLINKELLIPQNSDGNCKYCGFYEHKKCKANEKNVYINGIKYEDFPSWNTICIIYSILKGEEVKDKRELLVAKIEDSIKFEIKKEE